MLFEPVGALALDGAAHRPLVPAAIVDLGAARRADRAERHLTRTSPRSGPIEDQQIL